MTPIVVHKLDHEGREVWSYEGEVLERARDRIVLEAEFDRAARETGPLRIEPGDRFVETFYADRWYNVFVVYGRNGEHKGWYVNIARPAQLEWDDIYQEDLAIDLVVSADGNAIRVLDQDEFEALDLPAAEAGEARRALTLLLSKADRGESPFDPTSLPA